MTPRKTLDQMSSDDLDQLHADLDRYEEVVGELNEKNIGLARQAARAEAALARVRALADRWENALAPDRAYARSLRAVLDGPAPTPGPAQATDAGHVIPVDGNPAAAHEAVRQMDADTTQPHTGLVVQPYTDHGLHRWVFRCWGTDTCDGLLSLGHTSQQWAERARDRHVREEHPSEEQPMPACTATIEGPHIPGGPVHCTREAGHPENHAALAPGTDGKLMWNDHHAGATPHQASSEEQR